MRTAAAFLSLLCVSSVAIGQPFGQPSCARELGAPLTCTGETWSAYPCGELWESYCLEHNCHGYLKMSPALEWLCGVGTDCSSGQCGSGQCGSGQCGSGSGDCARCSCDSQGSGQGADAQVNAASHTEPAGKEAAGIEQRPQRQSASVLSPEQPTPAPPTPAPQRTRPIYEHSHETPPIPQNAVPQSIVPQNIVVPQNVVPQNVVPPITPRLDPETPPEPPENRIPPEPWQPELPPNHLPDRSDTYDLDEHVRAISAVGRAAQRGSVTTIPVVVATKNGHRRTSHGTRRLMGQLKKHVRQ